VSFKCLKPPIEANQFAPDIAEHIRKCPNDPSIAYQVAQKYLGEVRPDWDQIRIQEMDKVLWCKFAQHPTLLQELLFTGDAEIVNNTEHSFWGIGPTGDGSNEWGKALERLRASIREFGVDKFQSVDATFSRVRVLVFNTANPYSSFDMLSPHPVIYNGLRYPTGFHLYQSLKFSPEMAEWIRTYSEDPSEIDLLQQNYIGAVRADWDQVRVDAWDQALWCKFTQHPSLLKELLSTCGASIIYDTNHPFWGVGSTGAGQNEAGKALERLRSTFC